MADTWQLLLTLQFPLDEVPISVSMSIGGLDLTDTSAGGQHVV
jgi:hypothetical protein